jgi:hypothetical protein
MTSSVSFRITRTAEDLAQTMTALSQRLVKIEQRQEVMELQLRQQLKDVNNVPDEELATLDGIETCCGKPESSWRAQTSTVVMRYRTIKTTRMSSQRPRRGSAGCQNKKKGNYGVHHSRHSCL